MFSLREWAGLLFKQAREDLGYSQQFVADELEIDNLGGIYKIL